MVSLRNNDMPYFNWDYFFSISGPKNETAYSASDLSVLMKCDNTAFVRAEISPCSREDSAGRHVCVCVCVCVCWLGGGILQDETLPVLGILASDRSNQKQEVYSQQVTSEA